MRVAVYHPEGNPEHQRVLDAFCAGVRETGDLAFFRHLPSTPDQADCDVAVVFGVRKAAVEDSNARGDVIDAYRASGKRVVILEKGYVRRDEYYAAGWDGLNGRADFMNAGSPIDRWCRLDTELRELREYGNHVLLAAQVPWDASVQFTNHFGWLLQTINTIQEYTDRQIRLRPHPLAAEHIPLILGIERSELPRSLEDDLTGAHAIVTFNSNVGVDAAIAGVPVFCADRGSMAWGAANHNLDNIETPETFDRGQWAADLAYTQWNLEEMREGLAWYHLRDGAFATNRGVV